jgi:Arc/MetJ-type ribon-helix-helix transcriptional regulator
MPVRDPKNKTISFRLSQQEYVVADQARQERNFESMSVFARYAVLAYSSTPLGTAMDAVLESMKHRLDAVVQQVADLTKRFEGS